jgi:hypothetical protein
MSGAITCDALGSNNRGSTMVSGGKPVQIGVRLSAETKKAAEKAAKDDFRTVSGLVEKLLIEYLREKGYLRK